MRYNRLARRVVSAAVDTAVRVWDTLAPAPATCLRRHLEPVMALATDPARVVSADSGGWVFLWDFQAPPGADGDPLEAEGVDDGYEETEGAQWARQRRGTLN